MKKILIITLISVCFSSCVKPPFVDVIHRIIITNNSSNEIRVQVADQDATNQYPDRKLPLLKPSLQSAKISKSCYFDSDTTWEENIKKLPRDTLSIYIIDNAVYENEPWENIRNNDKILKRWNLSLQDLKNMNWTIIYNDN